MLMRLKVVILFLCISPVFSGISYSANYPFPQDVDYAYGNKPLSASSADALNAYRQWKNAYYVDMGDGTGRVIYNGGNQTVSEGIGYGMLLAAYQNDQDVFDKLWNYYSKYMNSNGVMNWKINSDGTLAGYNGATDADEDAAMALVIAHYQWGSGGNIDYTTAAHTLINNIMKYEVEANTFVLKPGDAFGGSNQTNPSYFAPAYYRIYFQITGDSNWLNVLDKSYEILAANMGATTGLVSDWCNASGTGLSGEANFTYDACRNPWRIAVDYLWFGEARAQSQCEKIASFLKNTVKASINIVDGYTRDGTKIGNSHKACFVGPFTVSMMAAGSSYLPQLNLGYNDLIGINNNDYFSSSLKAISLLVLTGNFYRLPIPVCVSPNLGPDVSLCDKPQYTFSTGIDSAGHNFLWNTNATTSEITVSQPGVYWVKTDSMGCVRWDTVVVTTLDVKLGNDTSINVDGITLSSSVKGNNVSYHWSTGATSSAIFVNQEGTYWVRVDSSICGWSDTISITYKYADSIHLYPNPSSGPVYLLLFDPRADQATVEIFSETGAKISELSLNPLQKGTPSEMNLSGYASGLYILRIRTNSSRYVRKIFIY